MINLENHYLGTNAKLLIQDMPMLTKAIYQTTLLVKEQRHENTEPKEILLSDRQLNDALNGPFGQFFKLHLSALGEIAKVTLASTLAKKEVLKPKDFEEKIELDVPENITSSVDSAQLSKLHKSLEEKVKEHFDAFNTQIQQWSESLLNQMQKSGLTLTEIEQQDFTLNEPLSELNDRFINLKIALPKLKKKDFDFQQYFSLKLTLAIHSALSRSHQPNSDKDIQRYMQKCKANLKSIHDTESNLINTQKKTLAELLKPLA